MKEMKKRGGYPMKNIALVIAAILLATTFPLIAIGGNNDSKESAIILNFSFEEPTIEKVMIDGGIYDRIEISNLPNCGNSGEPLLPVKPVNILLPQKTKAREIEVNGKKILFGKGYRIEPQSQPVPLSTDPFDYPSLSPNRNIYGSDQPFPGDLYTIVGTYDFRGYSILTVNLHPVQYIPKTREIYYYKEMTLNVKLEESSINGAFRGLQRDEVRVREIVDNPEIVSSYRTVLDHPTMGICDPDDTYEYVIITTEDMNSSAGDYTFHDLIDSKIDKGMNATIVTVEDITSDPAYWVEGEWGDANSDNPFVTNPVSDYDKFNDTQAKIRNFIRDAYSNWETDYILIGGDADDYGDMIVPVRDLWVRAYPGGDTTNMPSDTYYACLNGSYNYDEDNRWGEPTDGPDGGDVDLYAEVYVGRACVDSDDEVSNFVMKTLAYDNTTDPYLENVTMAAEYLGFGGVAEWGGNYKDEMIDGSSAHGYTTTGIPSDIYNITTLYDRDYPGHDWPKSEIMDIMDGGVNIINHLGHAGKTYVMKMYNYDVDSLTNDEYFFAYSQGCECGWFDYNDCIAEHFTLNENGAFAVIMNARYGWGRSYSTDGPSQRYDREFYDAIYGENITEIGKANQDSKEDNVYRIDEDCMRWCYYELNLFGDPEISIKKPVTIPEHDIAVKNLEAPDYAIPSTIVYVNATIVNQGLSDETDILVNFTVDGIVKDCTTIDLGSGDSTEVSFSWVPSSGVYIVGIEASPVPGEELIDNNAMNKTVVVGPDIAVTHIFVPKYVRVNTTTDVYAIVANLGKIDEIVNVELKIDGVKIANVSISLNAETSEGVSFIWHPTEIGDHDVEVYTEPVPDEIPIDNNQKDKVVTVYEASGYILLVDDDKGKDYEIYYKQALESNDYLYDLCDRDEQGCPGLETLFDYSAIIWFTGDDSTTTFEPIDRDILMGYLEDGGKMFVTGQNIGYDIHGTDFYDDYLHADYLTDDTDIYTLEGAADDPIGNGLAIGISDGDGAGNQDYPSGVAPRDPATSVFTYQDSTYRGGIKVDSGYRAVYFSFGFEAINNSDDRNEVMGRTMGWLIDIIPPEISDVRAIPEMQVVGGFVNITCKVTDNVAVDEVFLNITYPDSLIENFSITNNRTSAGIYYCNKTYLQKGTYTFFIWADDITGNSNVSSSHEFAIIDVTPPEISDVDAYPDPQVMNEWVNITCEARDNIEVDTVKVAVDGTYHLMTNVIGTDEYYYNATYPIPKTYDYFIWANDTSGNENTSAVYKFTILDTELPEISNLEATPSIQEVNGYVSISATVVDNVKVNMVKLRINGPGYNVNVTMCRIFMTNDYYYNANYSTIGTYNYSIWTNDASGNVNVSATKQFEIKEIQWSPWLATIDVEETDGSGETFMFGEDGDASDGFDAYDEEHESYPPPELVIYSIVDETKLIKDMRNGPDTDKKWDIYVNWTGDNSTIVSITWNVSNVTMDEYSNVALYDVDSDIAVNMRFEERYSYESSGHGTHHLQIICNTTIYPRYITTLKENWNLFSLPFNHSITLGKIRIVYEDVEYLWVDAANEGIIYGVVYDWNRNEQHYDYIYDPNAKLHPGRGYWIISHQECELRYPSHYGGSSKVYITTLENNWNLFGLPFDHSITLDQLSFVYDGKEYTWEEAISPENHIIYGVIYDWNRAEQRYNYYYDPTDSLHSGYGYWIICYVTECEMRYNPSS